jgi:hypothetical protein
MRTKHLVVVASFRTSDEKQALEVKEEVTRLLEKRAKEQADSSLEVILRTETEDPGQTPDESSLPWAPMSAKSVPLSYADVFEIKRVAF